MSYRILFYLLIMVLWWTSCRKNQKDSYKLSAPEPTIVTVEKIGEGGRDFSLSMYALIQANESGLYITPSQMVDDTVLYRYPAVAESTKFKGYVRQGGGPKELEKVQLSSKTADGDCLLFYSNAQSRFLAIDSLGVINAVNISDPDLTKMGYAFAYNKAHLAFSMESLFGGEHLITIINTKNGNKINAFPRRVPFGYEPSVRNEVFAMAAIPDGFAIAFVGDRKIFTLNYSGEQTHELILGKSEPIGTPFKVQNPADAPASVPYIPKMEYHNGHLFVLMDQLLWIISYDDFVPIKRLKLLRDPAEEAAPVTDFSITDNVLYVRMGRDELFKTTVEPGWFKAEE